MTSRISFSKILKEEYKHHLVSIFLVDLFFILKTLFFYFEVQDVKRRIVTENLQKETLISMGGPKEGSVIMIMVLAVVLAAEYFSYLQSQRKSDFYLSLPIKRKQQFALGATVSGIIFAIPFVLNVGIEMLMISSAGYGSKALFVNSLWKLGYGVLVFALMWIMTAFCVIATGHLVVAMLLLGLVSAYVPLILKQLSPVFEEFFYVTYYYVDNTVEAWNYFSPVTIVAGLLKYWNEPSLRGQYLIVSVIFLIIVSVCALLLYERRPAEAAGRAMAFEKVNPIVKLIFVIPLALYFGYFFTTMSLQESKGWLIFGTLFGAVLIHGLAESIFCFDLKQMFSKRLELVVVIGACLGFLFWMEMNTGNYNTYVPDSQKIESVSVFVNSDNIHFYNTFEDTDALTGEVAEKALALATNAVEQSEIYDESRDELCFIFTLANGKVEGRRYMYDVDKNRAELDELFVMEDFKDDFYEIYQLDAENITKIVLENIYQPVTLRLSEQEKKELLEIYKEELTAQTFTDMENNIRIGNMQIYHDGVSWPSNFYLCDEFEKTLTYLEERGYKVEHSLKIAEVQELELYVESEEKDTTYIVKDKDVLNEIKEQMILCSFYGNDCVYKAKDMEYANIQINVLGMLYYQDVYVSKELSSKLIEIAGDLR